MNALRRALALVAPPFCWSCGADAGAAEPLCPGCRANLRWLGDETIAPAGVETWAPLAYEGPARALVRALKFRAAAGLAEPMSAQIVASAPASLLRWGAVLVPVPLHPARARKRGYNQAALLAAAIARRSGIPLSDCLRRRGAATVRQVGRGRAERLVGIAGAVELAPRVAPPEYAVLVDDVVTTGSTLAACAAPLHAAGTTRVAAVAYARTPGR